MNCQQCKENFTPSRKSGKLSPSQAKKRKYCGNKCSAIARGISKEQHAKMIAARTYPVGKDNPLYIDGRCSHPGYLNWKKNQRNRLKKYAEGDHTFEEWEELKAEYNYTCPCCGQSEPEIKLTEDHIKPLSKKGTDYIINIQPLCLSCNISKSDRTVKY